MVADKSAKVSTSDSSVITLGDTKLSDNVSAIAKMSADSSPGVALRGTAKQIASAVAELSDKAPEISAVVRMRGV